MKFNILSLEKDLEANGFTPQQARVLAEKLAEGQGTDDLVAKDYWKRNIWVRN